MLAVSRFFFFAVVLTAIACEQPALQTYPHDDEPIIGVRDLYDGGLELDEAVQTFRNTHRLFPVRTVEAAENPRDLPAAAAPLGDVQFTFQDSTWALVDYLENNRVAGLLVLKDGEILHETYRYGNTEETRWMSMSMAKSISSTLAGAAIQDGYIAGINDLVTKYVPELQGTAYDGVTIRHVLTMTSGAQWNETYTDPESDRRELLEAQISGERGKVLEVMKELGRAEVPGSVFLYNTGEPQILAEVLYNATGRSLSEYLSEKIWVPMGAEAPAWWWLDAEDGIEIAGSGFSATLRDYGRFGQFVLENGVVDGEAILPDGWIDDASSPIILPEGHAVDYGYYWWIGTTPVARRDGAFSADGIYGQTLYINPAAGVVIVSLSAWPEPLESGAFDWDWSFYEAVVDSVR